MKKLISFFVMFLLFSCTNDDVDISIKPTNSKSARDIGFSIAKIAKCRDLEGFDTPYGMFECRKNLNEKNSIGQIAYAYYTISVFFDENIMKKQLDKLIDSKVIFKKGKYYTILRNHTYEQYPEDGKKPIGMNPNRNINIEDYNDFPGEIVIP